MNLPSFARYTAIAILIVGARASPCPSSAPPQCFARQSSTQQKSPQTNPKRRTQKLANPLNDLLDEAQHDIDTNQFEAALTPAPKIPSRKTRHRLGPLPTRLCLHRLKTSRRSSRRIRTRHHARSKNVRSFPESRHSPIAKKIPPPPSPHCAEPSICFPRKAARVSSSATRWNIPAIFPAAVESYEAALRLDPRDVETVIHLGNLYVGLKRYSDAEDKIPRRARTRAEISASAPRPGANSGRAKKARSRRSLSRLSRRSTGHSRRGISRNPSSDRAKAIRRRPR